MSNESMVKQIYAVTGVIRYELEHNLAFFESKQAAQNYAEAKRIETKERRKNWSYDEFRVVECNLELEEKSAELRKVYLVEDINDRIVRVFKDERRARNFVKECNEMQSERRCIMWITERDVEE